MSPGACVFCRIIAAGEYDDEAGGVVSFEPLNPVSPGHRLIVPVVHVADALEDAGVTARVMEYAVHVANARQLAPCNIMTSVGAAATQSVFHLHLHIVPRSAGDGLMLPWTEQQARAAGPLARG
jgi:histidine triad (HIT) family protein